jgi:hypothetical protein
MTSVDPRVKRLAERILALWPTDQVDAAGAGRWRVLKGVPHVYFERSGVMLTLEPDGELWAFVDNGGAFYSGRVGADGRIVDTQAQPLAAPELN